MRLSSQTAFAFAALLAGAALAAAQAPPPPPPNGTASPPPLKQKQQADDGDRRDPNRPRPAAGQLPDMDGVAMPEVTATTEEPVTSSGNVDLWRARIAERRARAQQATTSDGTAPH